jgi:hypothetical protein
MTKWLLLALCVISTLIGIYCFRLSRAAQKVVTAVNGPPVLRVPVDFSKPFTNEFAFRHSVKPFYGTVYLKLEPDPWPKDWTTRDLASEALQKAKGEMRVLSTNGSIVDQRDLNWFYGRFPHAETNDAPLQQFFSGLPLGEYRLLVATTVGVPQLNGVRQELVLRYDLIHERSIAGFFRTVTIVLLLITCVFGVGFFLQLKR